MGDISEKIIKLTSEKGTVYSGVRTINNGKYNEVWTCISKEPHKEVKGAYISESRLESLKVSYKSHVISKSKDFKEKLEGLLQAEQNQKYSDKEGYFVILNNTSKGNYDLNYRKVKAEIIDVKKPAQSTDDLEFKDLIVDDIKKTKNY